MRNHSKRNRAAVFAACEALEERRLFVAFQLFVDGVAVPGPKTVDYGTVTLNSTGPTHTIAYKYLGTSTVDVSANLLNGQNAYQQTAGDENNKVLSQNQTYSVTYKLLTSRAVPRVTPLTFFFTETGGESDSKEFTLNGNVLPANLNKTDDFGQLTNATKTPSGQITARFRQDGEGNTLEQVQPYLAAFELPSAQSKLDVSFTGSSVYYSEIDLFTSGKLSLLMTKDANGDGKLSISEREDANAVKLTTGQISENSPASRSTSVTRGAGKYLVFISAAVMDQTAFDFDKELAFSMQLKVDDIIPPTFQVRGNNVVINNNDTSPSTADGTNFGEVDQGAAPTLTFSVNNIGQTTMNIDGQRPNVTGDFIIFEDGLNSTIGAGSSDTFKVQLSNTSPGEKSGTIVIQSANAAGGNFTFKIGGTVTAAAFVPPFTVVTGSTLTVTGIIGNDNLTSTATGSSFKFTRNGVDSATFSTAAITKIVINLLDGNDNYSSATQLDIKQTINGGAGNDLIRAGKQADVMNGGDGDDRMDGRTRGDVFNGEGGSDTAIYRQRRANEPVTVIIDELPNDGGGVDQSKDNVLSSTEHVQGGLGNDRLTGSSKTNRLFGFEGNDTIVGLKGNDTLDGGSGVNDLNGGFGNDQLFSRNSIADVIDGGADTDTLTGDLIDSVSNVETPNLV
ncbi:MAG: choice-of-anchor D domain-containing protein [Anaerolineae bacterium]|nr:choice-of-anchor D domain-containing protein [Phycisphaerae bacterium]